MDARALAELHELLRRDEELAAETARLEELGAAVARTRSRAEAIDEFFAGYTVEDSRLRTVVAAAEEELARRHTELTAAERDLAAARDDVERERAESACSRARDHVTVAESSLLRARSAHDELEHAAAELPAELTRLESDAQAVSATTPDLPSPGVGPRALSDWASHAHAELFVALSQLAAQRERLTREANELASMLLGDPTYGSTVAQALRRVEAGA